MGDIAQCKMYVDGKWVAAAGGRTFNSINPGTWQVLAAIPLGTAEDAHSAVDAARRAWETYRWTPVWERSALLKKISAVVAARREELARALSLEQGKPYHTEALGEIGAVISAFEDAGEQIKWLETPTIPVQDPNKRVVSILQARGVYAVITPWNYPCNIPCEYITAALATGNTVVWNPASSTSLCAVKLTECFVEAGVPAGVINLVTGPGTVVGAELVAHPGTCGIGFTGSTEVGNAIARQGAGKPMLLELGGNGPSVILKDADLDRAVARVAAGCFTNAGQICAATERILVAREVFGEVAERMLAQARAVRIGEQLAEGTTMGPMNNKKVFDKNVEHAEDARSRGAKFLCGGGPSDRYDKGWWFEPTVVVDVSHDSLYNLGETFGPVAPLIPFSTPEEALKIANMDEWGLVKSVFTRDLQLAVWFGERLRSGIVNVNDNNCYWELHLPFGGAGGKRSGFGRLGGKNTMLAMSDIKTITFDIG